MQEKLEELIEQSKKLEENIIASVIDSSSDVEIILKELLIYLNATSEGLIKIQKQIDIIREPLEDFDKVSEKIDSMSQNIDDIPADFKKIVNIQTRQIAKVIHTLYDPMKLLLTKLNDYVKIVHSTVKNQSLRTIKQNETLLTINTSVENIEKDLKTTKEDILKSQDGLFKVIDAILQSKSNDYKASLDLKSKESDNQTDIQKQKINLIIKIVGYVMGSGGLIYFIIDMIRSGG